MQSHYPQYYQSECGKEQIKLFNRQEQAYIRAMKGKNGFDYCAYRNRLIEGEEERIKREYVPSSEQAYLQTLQEVITFFEEMRQKLVLNKIL